MVGVDVLLELLHRAQADHGPAAEPERRHGPKLLMQTDEELVQTASVHDVLQVPVPEREESHDVNLILEKLYVHINPFVLM